jgi:integrase
VIEIITEPRGHLHFGPPKTSAGRRMDGLPRFVVEALAERMAAPGSAEDLVFAGPHGGALRVMLFRRRFWLPAVKAAGLDGLRIHDLRHTAVALWIAAGANPKEVAARAGHASVSFTLDRYGHLYPEADLNLRERWTPSGRPAEADSDGLRPQRRSTGAAVWSRQDGGMARWPAVLAGGRDRA